MTTSKRQKIEANKAKYRKTHMKQIEFSFPKTEEECKTEEDRRCFRIAQASIEFIKKLDKAYEISKKSTLVFRAAVAKNRN